MGFVIGFVVGAAGMWVFINRTALKAKLITSVMGKGGGSGEGNGTP